MIYLIAWLRGALALAVTLGSICGLVASWKRLPLLATIGWTVALIGWFTLASLNDSYPQL